MAWHENRLFTPPFYLSSDAQQGSIWQFETFSLFPVFIWLHFCVFYSQCLCWRCVGLIIILHIVVSYYIKKKRTMNMYTPVRVKERKRAVQSFRWVISTFVAIIMFVWWKEKVSYACHVVSRCYRLLKVRIHLDVREDTVVNIGIGWRNVPLLL